MFLWLLKLRSAASSSCAAFLMTISNLVTAPVWAQVRSKQRGGWPVLAECGTFSCSVFTLVMGSANPTELLSQAMHSLTSLVFSMVASSCQPCCSACRRNLGYKSSAAAYASCTKLVGSPADVTSLKAACCRCI